MGQAFFSAVKQFIFMSPDYTHLLIPLSPEYRPEPNSVAVFGQGIINNGNVANPFTISFAPVTKAGPSARKVRNIVTGETISIRLPSPPNRKISDPGQPIAIRPELILTRPLYAIESLRIPVVNFRGRRLIIGGSDGVSEILPDGHSQIGGGLQLISEIGLRVPGNA